MNRLHLQHVQHLKLVNNLREVITMKELMNVTTKTIYVPKCLLDCRELKCQLK